MLIEQTEVFISTPDGQMPAVVFTPTHLERKPAVLLLMEAFGLTSHIQDVAAQIAHDHIQQIKSRFQELGKDYTLKVYPNAGHGFFCHERSDYNRLAAEDAWQQLTQFFAQHLRGVS